MRRRGRVEIQGAVQGVGFRPFVYRLARELGLDGWISNDTRGVVLELEGRREDLERFLERLPAEKPPPARIQETRVAFLEPIGLLGLRIEPSDDRGARTAQVLPDIATCAACRDELLDPADRRHGYPFINCTNCGPRFSILRSLPYDRPRTTMARFDLCERCRAEYEDPLDRRFHAQPNACAECGPQVALWGKDGAVLAAGPAALEAAAEALRAGRIVAVKGLGGFHLMVDARDGAAVGRLRLRKPRRDKPLALMARDLDAARALVDVDESAAALLASPEAPILLLTRLPGAPVHESVAPGNPTLGVMLAYTPLHRLLLGLVGSPVVATSGNLSDEPICTDEHEAVRRLGGIADLFLVHDRPIERHVDDSIAWNVEGSARLLRRARGYAPRPVLLDREVPTLLAVGPHLKNTVALSVGRQVFLSQHVGDLETEEAMAAFERVIADFLRLYQAEPVAVAHDLHPDYLSTRWAQDAVAGADGPLAGLPLVPVQHHHAHLAACLAENACEGPALGVTWDGTGFGADGTIWGGEFLLGDATAYRRAAHLREFRLPGGDAAVREPRRSAVGLLWVLGGEDALTWDDLAPIRSFSRAERRTLAGMLSRSVNAPRTTSAGRLFDAVAALVGLHQRAGFEGQAAMALEHAVDPGVADAYPLDVRAGATQPGGAPSVVDWRPLLEAVLTDLRGGREPGVIAARFHNGLVEAITAVAKAVGEPTVALTGGCFQNQLLVTRTAARLRAAGHRVLLHRETPPNDGGISLGQIAVAAAMSAGE